MGQSCPRTLIWFLDSLTSPEAGPASPLEGNFAAFNTLDGTESKTCHRAPLCLLPACRHRLYCTQVSGSSHVRSQRLISTADKPKSLGLAAAPSFSFLISSLEVAPLKTCYLKGKTIKDGLCNVKQRFGNANFNIAVKSFYFINPPLQFTCQDWNACISSNV